ncbi:TetR family transcriptional regulator [Curtobacterium sp. PhB130]|uniref:TetR/AcrR family transcriptional regulator n=1 Tax=unclassified Curtobacterium TaxID=257496 RepID=UPI000F4CD838|nr:MULTISPECIES: TetR/AcrR family transcriptional regulator [unclassified Curtobacterium]ROP60697.1 TetR family transcriptional regulator [Curtobacterium sp. ZW137]ROS76264.1 TetR family transcriptional regulator [Curtobacterium sp. PhB130]TCK59596.1 TetR family transcriptional regulator [Curtobacterium sp. PhB136]
MVDARILHTTAALREAILRLAADRPVSEITVADVTRAAGINRATFYSHAVSPGSLLADVLTPELDRIRDDDSEARRAAYERGADRDELAAITRKGINAVVEHVVLHREIYVRALPDPNDASLHRLLVEHFTVSSALHIRELDAASRPELLDDVAAGFVAQGFVGAIEAWLAGTRRSRKALVDTITRSFPAWWS